LSDYIDFLIMMIITETYLIYLFIYYVINKKTHPGGGILCYGVERMRSQVEAQDPVHKSPYISTDPVSTSSLLPSLRSQWCSSPLRNMLGLRGSVRLLTEINQSLLQNATVSLTNTCLFITRLH
jgi:hypothetical protein